MSLIRFLEMSPSYCKSRSRDHFMFLGAHSFISDLSRLKYETSKYVRLTTVCLCILCENCNVLSDIEKMLDRKDRKSMENKNVHMQIQWVRSSVFLKVQFWIFDQALQLSISCSNQTVTASVHEKTCSLLITFMGFLSYIKKVSNFLDVGVLFLKLNGNYTNKLHTVLNKSEK